MSELPSELKPDLPAPPGALDALFLSGLSRHQQGQLDAARTCYDEVLARHPQHFDALHLRGVLAAQSGDFALAIELMTRAQALQPGDALVAFNLGKAQLDGGAAAAALASFECATGLNPGYADAWNNRGVSLHALRRYAEAVECYEHCIRLQPDLARAHYNLGVTRQQLQQHAAAALNYRQALAIQPDYGQALINLGAALRECGFHGEAADVLRRALQLQPRSAPAAFALGQLLVETGELKAARSALADAIRCDPGLVEARWALAMSHIPVVHADVASTAETLSAFEQAFGELEAWFAAGNHANGHRAVGLAQPFYLAYLESDVTGLLARHGALCHSLMRHWQLTQPGSRPTPPRHAPGMPVRVGIVSAHLYGHSVWNAITRGWLEHLHQAGFELHLFHTGLKHDDETLLARRWSASFTDSADGLRGWMDAILAARPHVLLYPEIGMDATTLELASMRLAPVQAAAWGHPQTTGLPCMDYFISADALEPENAQAHYTEQLVRLPGLGCVCAFTQVVATEPDLAALGIAPDQPLLICPGTPYKYTPAHDGIWVAIARRLGRCQLVFFRDEPPMHSDRLRLRLEQAFAQAGLDSRDFVRFVPWQSQSGFFGLLHAADACLDTVGFSGFNTALQVLECGLPMVTCEGPWLRSRLASGIFRQAGLDELIADTDQAYVDLAVRLVQDRAWASAMRRKVQRASQAIRGDAAPVRALERWLDGVVAAVCRTPHGPQATHGLASKDA